MKFTDLAFFFLVVLSVAFIIIIYSSSFKGTWQYDDYANILENHNVHLESFSPSSLGKTLQYTNHHNVNRVKRPLAYFSFSLNYYFGGLNPWGYHLANLVIHLCSSVLLFFFIQTLLRAPRMADRYGNDARWIALASAALWATHPIHVTAVTYIVQRMASMAALFALLSIYSFLQGRLASTKRARYLLYGLSAAAYLAGLAAKENVVLIPLCMLMLDIGIIRGFEQFSIKRLAIWCFSMILLLGLLIWLFVVLGQVNLMDSFPNRPYTPFQRVITQPRVLFMYLMWLYIPMRSHLTLVHDIEFSSNLLNPITTLPAILLLFAVVAGLLILLKRHPVPAYCALFFFCNHLVESSFLNLGMVYEHRNYLPSMLIFVPLSIGILHLCRHRRIQSALRIGCMAGLVGFVFSNGYLVYTYNKVFQSEWSLWFDVSMKSPKSSIGQNNLGKVLWDAGAYDNAYERFVLAMELNRWSDLNEKGMVHYNIGLYHAYITKDYNAAMTHFRQTIGSMRSNPATWYQLARTYLLLDQTTEAERVLKEALSHWETDVRLALEMAIVQLLAGRMDAALDWVKFARQIIPSNRKFDVVEAEIHRRMGAADRATGLFNRYLAANQEKHSQIDEMLAAEKRPGQVARLLLELSGIDGRLFVPCPRSDTSLENEHSEI